MLLVRKELERVRGSISGLATRNVSSGQSSLNYRGRPQNTRDFWHCLLKRGHVHLRVPQISLSITQQYSQSCHNLLRCQCLPEHSWECPKVFFHGYSELLPCLCFHFCDCFCYIPSGTPIYTSNESEKLSMSITQKDYFFKLMASPLHQHVLRSPP